MIERAELGISRKSVNSKCQSRPVPDIWQKSLDYVSAELDRLSLVIESAVRRADPSNALRVTELLKSNRALRKKYQED